MRLVQSYEITECDREAFDGIKRIDAQGVLKTRNNQGETQGVQARMEKLEIVGQGTQLASLLARDLLKVAFDGFPDRHFPLHCIPRLQDYNGHEKCGRWPAPEPGPNNFLQPSYRMVK
jgi:hypothetical protein